MAFVAFSQGNLLNMTRSAAMLSPIAHMGRINSDATRLAAKLFLANVCDRHTKLYLTKY